MCIFYTYQGLPQGSLQKMQYCYDYPRPAVTTDIVVFTLRNERLSVLLIRRARDPYAGYWALPGGFVEPDETLEQGALRELQEETGLTQVYLEQLYTFGEPQRDPRGRVISVRISRWRRRKSCNRLQHQMRQHWTGLKRSICRKWRLIIGTFWHWRALACAPN